jgi:hypothetical protein
MRNPCLRGETWGPRIGGDAKLLYGFPEAYGVAFWFSEPGEGAGGDGDGGDYGFAAGGFYLLEAGGDVVVWM